MSSGFITEAEIELAKQKKQEEWDRVRQPDQPEVRPEEPIDSRSLYIRLKEQKDKKDLEYEEAHKLKNLIRGLVEDEVEFLDVVDRAKLQAKQLQQLEENKELDDYRQKVATLTEQKIENKLNAELGKSKPKVLPQQSTRLNQKSILTGVIRKRKNEESENDINQKTKIDEKSTENIESTSNVKKNGGLYCIGILPGIGKYCDSSDSDSSDTDDEQIKRPKCDLIGRKRNKEHTEEK